MISRKSFWYRQRFALAVAVLLIVHAALLTWSATRNSVTFDEFGHLPAGLSYWKHGRFDIYDYTPPLPRLLGSWPALLAGARTPGIEPYLAMTTQERHWLYGEKFLRENADSYHHIFVLGRLGLIPLSCLCGWLVFHWSSRLHGSAGGVLSCALYSFCPNVIAHSSIVGTDLCTML